MSGSGNRRATTSGSTFAVAGSNRASAAVAASTVATASAAAATRGLAMFMRLRRRSHLRENLLGEMESRVRSRYPRIDRALEDHFLDLVAGDAVVERRAHVQLELVGA